MAVENGAELYAMGTEKYKINITHNSTWATTCEWRQIEFESGSSGSLSFCNFSRGGKGALAVLQISTSGNIIVENCKINYSTNGGIYTDSGSPTIRNNTIHDCTTGIDIGGGNPFFYNNSINGTTTGILISTGSPTINNTTISVLS